MITEAQEIKILDTFSKGLVFKNGEYDYTYLGEGKFKCLDNTEQVYELKDFGNLNRLQTQQEYETSQEIEEISKEIKEILFEDYELVAEEFGIIWDRLLKYTQFFQRPAARYHHHIYEGGLAYHSAEVTIELLRHTERLNLKWQRNDRYISPYIVGIAHDLCKVLCYNADGSYNTAVNGHGDLSVQLWDILFPDIPLTEEETVCIEHHMGVYMKDMEYCKEFNNLCSQYPNLLYTCMCDLRSSTGIVNLRDQ